MLRALTRRLKNFSRWHIEKNLLSVAIRPDANAAATVHVADMLVPTNTFGPESICYCAGVGEDIRFEQYLVDSFRAQVWAFDPTPRAIRYIESTPHDRTRLHFLPFGLWKEDTTLRFYAPADPRWVSHSVMEDLGGGGFFDAPCRSVPNTMASLGHTHLDLLKMNIEGAEHIVLESTLAAGIFPRVIILTYEGDDALLKARRWTARLRREGYAFVGRQDWFCTYVRREPSRRPADNG